MKTETKIAKLGIESEVEKILNEAELYNPAKDTVEIIELSKMKKSHIQEEIGNYLDWTDKEGNDYDWNWKYCRMSSFCKAFGISENRIAEWYARAIAESGYCLAYEVNEDVVLVIEEK